MDFVIETRKTIKRFGKITAVDDLSMSVRKGEIYGFLGLNGAGKTTTIRMLLGMIRPSSGEVLLFGKKVAADCTTLWRKVGYLVEIPYSYPGLTVRENLEISRRMHLVADHDAVDRVIEVCKLDHYSERLSGKLSLGNAQRLGIAKALLHGPELLLLDEPANGLDPAGIVEIRELLCDLAFNRNVTIFVSSHVLGEIAKTATRIGIIHEGRLVQETNFTDLEKYRKRSLRLDTRDRAGAKKVLELKGLSVDDSSGKYLEIHDRNVFDRPDDLTAYLAREGYPPMMIGLVEEDLETYFLRVVRSNGGI